MSSTAVTSVGVAKLKASLSAYLAKVKAGHDITVTEHGRPIARLVPVSPADENTDAHLARLERAGLVRRGRDGLLEALAGIELPDDSEGLALAALLDERELGR